MKRFFWALLLPAIPLFVQAQAIDFKGVPIGATKAEFSAAHPDFHCTGNGCFVSDFATCKENPMRSAAYKLCSDRVNAIQTYAGVAANHLFIYFDDEGRLGAVSVSLPSASFGFVAAALESKYGAPERATEEFKTKAGATFENSILTWRKDGNFILAKRLSGSTDLSSVRISSDTYASNEATKAAAKIKKRAGDL